MYDLEPYDRHEADTSIFAHQDFVDRVYVKDSILLTLLNLTIWPEEQKLRYERSELGKSEAVVDALRVDGGVDVSPRVLRELQTPRVYVL